MDLCTIQKDNLKYMYKGAISVNRDFDDSPYLSIKCGNELTTIDIDENIFKKLVGVLGSNE